MFKHLYEPKLKYQIKRRIWEVLFTPVEKKIWKTN